MESHYWYLFYPCKYTQQLYWDDAGLLPKNLTQQLLRKNGKIAAIAAGFLARSRNENGLFQYIGRRMLPLLSSSTASECEYSSIAF